MVSQPAPSAATHRQHYAWFKSITTRWIDNDVYGHVNNAVYYTWFDTVANSYLIEQGGLDIEHSPVVGFIVASSCQYRRPIRFPDAINGGLRVNRLGRSSVEYGLGIFPSNDDDAAAHGTFTHVFVDRSSGKSVPIPSALRAALRTILQPPTA